MQQGLGSKLGDWYPACSKVVGLLSFDIVAAWPQKIDYFTTTQAEYLSSGVPVGPSMDPWKIDENSDVSFTLAHLEATWRHLDASSGTMECPACLQEGSASLQECPVDPQMSLRRSPRVSRWSPKVSKGSQKSPEGPQHSKPASS